MQIKKSFTRYSSNVFSVTVLVENYYFFYRIFTVFNYEIKKKIFQFFPQVAFFNNYLMDPKRPALAEHPGNKQGSSSRNSAGGEQFTNPGGYQGMPPVGFSGHPPMMYGGGK